MSLINKMLQDLDARGTPAAESFPSQIRPVAPARQGLAAGVDPKAVAAVAAGTLAALALGWFGLAQYRQAHSRQAPIAATAAPASQAAKLAPSAVKPGQGMSGTLTMGPANANASATAAPPLAPAAPAPVVPAAESKNAAAIAPPDAARAAHQATIAAPRAGLPADGVEQESQHESKHEAQRNGRHEAPHDPQRASKQESNQAQRPARKSAPAAAESTAKPARAADTGAAVTGRHALEGREESAFQRAEGEYRRALASLQDGRMTDTVAALEQALALDPGHDAARQTLVGLLIEAKRPDEAMRHLQAALALDARQPALAMLLARLQIERGGSGIETLMRTLPYAGNDAGKGADYHAFLAAALARAQRHREAAEQYQAALRAAPGNGVWWMGLGMSLQADKRGSEAREAFQRARASGTLGAELQAFVERRLQQLR